MSFIPKVNLCNLTSYLYSLLTCTHFIPVLTSHLYSLVICLHFSSVLHSRFHVYLFLTCILGPWALSGRSRELQCVHASAISWKGAYIMLHCVLTPTSPSAACEIHRKMPQSAKHVACCVNTPDPALL